MKKVLVKLLIILIILIIIGVGAFFGYTYFLELKNKDIQEKFYSYVFQNNLKNVLDYSLEETILSKIKGGGYTSKTEVEFSNSFSNDYNFEIDKLTLELFTKSDIINKKTNIKFNYSNNELFALDVLNNNDYIAVKNSDVLNNYMGLKKDKIKLVLSKINPDLKELYKKIEYFNQENIINQNNNNIFIQNNDSYISNLKKYINSKKYIDEGKKIIEQNGNKLETTAYSLTMSKEEFLRIYAVLTQLIIEDENIQNSIIYSDDVKKQNNESIQSNLNFNDVVKDNKKEIYSIRGEINPDNTNTDEYLKDSISESEVLNKVENLIENTNAKSEEFEKYKSAYNFFKYLLCASTNFGSYIDSDQLENDLNEIFQNINEVINEKIDDDAEIKIITYVFENNTVKTSVFLGDNVELNIDYINQNSNKFITAISILEKKEDKHNGYTINLTKNKTTAIDNNTIEIGIINESKIVSKLELKLNVEGTTNSNKYTNNFSFSYSGKNGKFSSNIINDLSFGKSEIETINGDNTLLIDSLENEDFYYTINKLNSKIDSVYEEKISKLNLINANTSDTIIQGNDQENYTTSENDEEKEKLIDLLVEKISNEMGIAEQEENDYTIQDLKNLEIEGYNIQVSVSEEIAIIKINNYTFKIDKDFNLSE